MNWGECYYDHFTGYLGHPIAREVFEHGMREPSIQVLAYDNVFDNCRCFCSLGLTHYAKQVHGPVEVFLPIDDGWQDVPYVLANALFFMVQNTITMERGTHITGVANILPNFAAAFGKTALYFTIPYGLPDSFGQVACGKAMGRVYLACFISASESIFLDEYGVEAFETMLETQDIDLFNLRRHSCV
jgi:hypothetical protein